MPSDAQAGQAGVEQTRVKQAGVGPLEAALGVPAPVVAPPRNTEPGTEQAGVEQPPSDLPRYEQLLSGLPPLAQPGFGALEVALEALESFDPPQLEQPVAGPLEAALKAEGAEQRNAGSLEVKLGSRDPSESSESEVLESIVCAASGYGKESGEDSSGGESWDGLYGGGHPG